MVYINEKRFKEWVNSLEWIDRSKFKSDDHVLITQGDPGRNALYLGAYPLGFAVSIYPRAYFNDLALMFDSVMGINSNVYVKVYGFIQKKPK